MGDLIIVLLYILFLIVPLVLTGINLFCVFIEKKRLQTVSEVITWIMGLLFTTFLYQICVSNEWWFILMPREMVDGVVTHTFIPGLSRMASCSILLYKIMAYGMAGIGAAGYVLLRWFRRRLRGNVKVICVAGMMIGFGLSIWWSIRLPATPFLIWYLRLLPLNFMIFVISMIRTVLKETGES